VVNDAASAALLDRAVDEVLGTGGRAPTAQSLGGEDFAWFLREVPGALVRLGTRAPGGPDLDLHQPNFDIDEAAIETGIRTLVAVARAGTA
jgi:amidohydrolase